MLRSQLEPEKHGPWSTGTLLAEHFYVFLCISATLSPDNQLARELPTFQSSILYTIANPPPSDPIFILTNGPVVLNLYQIHALVNSMTEVTRIMYHYMIQGFGHLSLAFALRYRPAKLNTAGSTENTNTMKETPSMYCLSVKNTDLLGAHKRSNANMGRIIPNEWRDADVFVQSE